MYMLNVISHFSSAHSLKDYQGPCRNLHGHNWKVRVGIACARVDEKGLAMDFGLIKKMLEDVLSLLDHKYLNDLQFFKDCNPTSENIARFIHDEMKNKLGSNNCSIREVEVWESDLTSLLYYE